MCRRRRSSGLDLAQLRLPPPTHRLPHVVNPPFRVFPAAVREAEKVEGLRFPFATPPSVPVRLPTELDEPRLVGMQRQPESRESVTQFVEEAFSFLSMLETHHKIVRETRDHDVAARRRPTPAVDPEVEDVVQYAFASSGLILPP